MSKTRVSWKAGLLALLLFLAHAAGHGEIMTDYASGGPLLQRCRIAPGAVLADHPDTYPWQDITPDLHWVAPVSVTVGAEDEQPEAFSQMTLTLRNMYSRVEGPMLGLDGRYTVDNELSDLWPDFEQNTPIEHALSTNDGADYAVTARMYLSAATDEWPSGTNEMALSRITADGVFRRMSQWEDLQSAACRSAAGVQPADLTPSDLWAMEDGPVALSFANAIPGRQPGLFRHVLSITDPGDVEPGGITGPAGARDLAFFPRGAAAQLPVDAYTDTGHWIVQGAVLAGDATSLWSATYRLTSGFHVDVVIDLTPGAGQMIVNVFNVAGSITASGSASIDTDATTGLWNSLVVDGVNLGGGTDRITAQLLDTNGTILADATLLNPGAYAMIKQIDLISYGAGEEGAGYGYWGVYLHPSSDLPPDGSDNARGLGGYVGELPKIRAARICAETGVPFEAIGTESGTSFMMGPQLPGRALDVLRDCERVGRAIMTDHLGLVQYYCLNDAYNQDPIIEVDGEDRELFMPWAPTLDDLGRANLVTMAQPDGTSATLRDDADIDGVAGLRPARGVYAKGPVTVNLSDPLGLLQQAGFERARGTQARRYPTMRLDGLRVPAQGIAMITSGKPRAKIRITNPPRSQRQEDVDVLLKGWTMTVLGPRRGWEFACNTVQSGPYEVGVYDDAGARYESASSALGANRTFGGVAPPTTMTITTNGAPGELWTTVGARYPIDVMVGGCRIRITAMTGAASPQTATISPTVINGAAKTVAAGTPVRLWNPVKYGL
jgi:hypothetical protein